MNYDNACKYLAEQYPTEFVRWLLAIEQPDVEVLKTELTLEPIRADSVTFLQTATSILTGGIYARVSDLSKYFAERKKAGSTFILYTAAQSAFR